ncbi:Esa1p-associated factor [Elasticomyces elasticus]|nr:Esa1p-associated factor [Elasticomyces elasticus]
MAPTATSGPQYAKDEKVLCFHHDLLYEAKVLELKLQDVNDRKGPYQYRVHYKGWKNTWDDWVPQDRLRKFSDENKELAAALKKEMDATRKATAKSSISTATKKRGLGSDLTGSSARGSEDLPSAPAPRQGTKRQRDYEGIEKEEDFNRRPAIRLFIPETIKSSLVDDWEKTTKDQKLVPIPSKTPVSTFLHEFREHELAKGISNQDSDILDEVVQGVMEYFNKSLGRILLYRFERLQYHDIHDLFKPGRALEGKQIGEVYGVEHLCRLFVSMPDLIAHTNMDYQGVTRLREELSKMTQWLSRDVNFRKYLTHDYEQPTQAYIDRAKDN